MQPSVSSAAPAAVRAGISLTRPAAASLSGSLTAGRFFAAPRPPLHPRGHDGQPQATVFVNRRRRCVSMQLEAARV